MRIFVSEFLTSGGGNISLAPASLLKEGTAMLSAIVSDFSMVAGCEVLTTWDHRLGPFPAAGPMENIEIRLISDPAEEREVFQQLCREADAAFLIAPEFQNLLADRCELVNGIGTLSLNCSVESIRRCSDKLALSAELESQEILTIPTREFAEPLAEVIAGWDFPLVIKPKDGAGSQDTFLIADEAEWDRLLPSFSSLANHDWIVQPYIPGRTLSVAAIVGEPQPNAEPWLEVFPLAEQHLSQDGRFGYLGGRMPETIAHQHLGAQRVREIARLLPGLSGYVGMDLLVPAENPEELLIVEINPRLTTSYLGYRALADGNLAEYLLPQSQPESPLRWKPSIVRFTADGAITWNE